MHTTVDHLKENFLNNFPQLHFQKTREISQRDTSNLVKRKKTPSNSAFFGHFCTIFERLLTVTKGHFVCILKKLVNHGDSSSSLY